MVSASSGVHLRKPQEREKALGGLVPLLLACQSPSGGPATLSSLLAPSLYTILSLLYSLLSVCLFLSVSLSLSVSPFSLSVLINYLDPLPLSSLSCLPEKNRLYSTTTVYRQRAPDWKSGHGIPVLALSLTEESKNSLLITMYLQGQFHLTVCPTLVSLPPHCSTLYHADISCTL